MGADAEYLCMRENGFLARKPENMSHDEAATTPYGAMMALNLLERLDLQPGARLLVNGASGGIGALLIQIAKHRYHAIVTGVCSTAKVETVRSLGADEVLDYTRQDFVESSVTYDLVIDVLGKSSFARVRRVLAPRGRLVYLSFKEKHLLQMLTTALGNGPKVLCVVLQERQENLELARELIEAGQIRTPLERVFPLAHVAEAHQYAQSCSRKGAVVLDIAATASIAASARLESRLVLRR